MADYDSFPLWRRDDRGTVNVDPSALPITPELAELLLVWADEYDRTLNHDDPLSSGFPDPTAENDFYVEGETLARRLASELGDARRITYFDGRTAADVTITP
jgi:hypothetical protein